MITEEATTQEVFIVKPCKRCRRRIGRDFGMRLEFVDDLGKLIGIVVSSYKGRCPSCFTRYDWFPSKRARTA